MTSLIPEAPYFAAVCLEMASNIVQPFSRQVLSPVIRYMMKTDSMASGLHYVKSNANIVGF